MLNGVAFLFVKFACFRFMVYYISYILFLVVERFLKCQQDKAAERKRNKTAADRFSGEQRNN